MPDVPVAAATAATVVVAALKLRKLCVCDNQKQTFLKGRLCDSKQANIKDSEALCVALWNEMEKEKTNSN